jgi:hypothetical protein
MYYYGDDSLLAQGLSGLSSLLIVLINVGLQEAMRLISK